MILTIKSVHHFGKKLKELTLTKYHFQAKWETSPVNTDISKLWKEHYCTLLNSVSSIRSRQFVIDQLKTTDIHEGMYILHGDVSDDISKLQKGKALGLDGIGGESLINFNSKLSLYLSTCFQSMLIHGYVPHSLMTNMVICQDLNNYGPVAIANTISNVFETILLLNRCDNYLYTSAKQFGFKTGHSTHMCIHTLGNSIAVLSITRNTTVFITFLDAIQGFRPYLKSYGFYFK